MVRQLSDGDDSGTLLGQSSSDKIGFYGLSVPIVKASVTASMTATSTTTQLETTIDAIGAALHNLGLITYST
jgi:hypothetical protein